MAAPARAFAIVAALSAAGDAYAADLAFAQRTVAGARDLVQFPVAQPTPTTVGPQADSLLALDFSPDAASLWALNATSQTFGVVNTSTAAYTPVGALAPGCCTGFAVDPARGNFYGTIDDDLYEINPANGALTQIGVFANNANPESLSVGALTLGCDGTGYAIARNTSGDTRLFRWRAGEPPVFVGATGYNGIPSLEVDSATGTLYAFFNAPGDPSSAYVTINPTTGIASPPIAVVEGRFRMAFRNACPPVLFEDGFED